MKQQPTVEQLLEYIVSLEIRIKELERRIPREC